MEWTDPGEWQMHAPSWISEVGGSLSSPAMLELWHKLRRRAEVGVTIVPRLDFVFRPFELVPLNKVKVVILGQDPYPAPRHATGVAFAVRPDSELPGTLRNMLAELKDDLETNRTPTLDLKGWTSQGVLLINLAATT